MGRRGTRGAYRREDRVALPKELQKELVEKAAAKYGNCQELAKHLNIPKSSVHYYRIGKLTMPVSVLEEMLRIVSDPALETRIRERGLTKDRNWATEYAQDVFREMCRERVNLPSMEELMGDDNLRRSAASLLSYVLTEGSIWLQKREFGECAVNITFADHETDLYNHFRSLCMRVFGYDIGPPQQPGNGAKAIRGFIYSRFIAEWLMENGVAPGDKAERPSHLPRWVLGSSDPRTWIAALQPWFDGEGSVAMNASNRPSEISISQSRHTDLDFFVLPHRLGWRGQSRGMPAGLLKELQVHGVSAHDYVSTAFRSPPLDDVAVLLGRLDIGTRTRLKGLYLKDDGFWSANWCTIIGSSSLRTVHDLGLVTQHRKLERIAGRGKR
jgi:hypothetical protein